ncbi:uncharacterized protein YlxW (UPF0749 family) [Clostridium acetobutylicum]|uniref:Conserved membrane protein n=1 Tax=Clostridium acetobutylicum (strain ATCC 824 / DSM 792 / JCM 1419 / IAM 19013 / LMG 5710 / NBRC 13948 / NRRL B-527 / VKM B-1787 / 2291 / W) TaxID=272562 RepID=Q97H91_CLOAB|nr:MULTISPECIES: DUF881 domain-containing protein [Clostridium]AAK80080.1 Conserved membrane protein [Clostridium acetobutylicum ATCC 824]ADZ21173.1 Conserved hypothetical protein [Clostridium acetobutylicum EA 2018]AEI33486.1 hypothetical protein SMB_G2155 [Clostridium acetobutylicum DSM 1731]AWV79493.1 DUF881 domain-containing protein [Clostridium acetobutylicum]MBC2394534.1 DUF881 domain-containing protein [Clostridium acetobutylicum]
MKNNEASIFIFIASVFLGVLISSNMSFGNKEKKLVYLNSKQYEDAYRKKSVLLNDINNINEQYFDLKNSIKDYNKSSKDFESTKRQMEDELILNKMELGTLDVVGEGVEITLDDSGNQVSASSEDANFREIRTIYQVIHDFDMRAVINDIKCSGAEAISINGQRIVSNTEIYCNAEFLLINGVKISAPFNIKAIGNKNKLKTYMLASGNYLQRLKRRSIYVNLKTVNDVKIPAFKGELRHSNIKSK